jgi:hypothetical protein
VAQGEEGTRKLVEECLALYAQQVRAAFAAPDTGEATTAGGVAVAGDGRELLDDVRQCILEVAACAKGLAPALAAVDLGPGNLLAPLTSELSLLFTSSIRRHTLARTRLSHMPRHDTTNHATPHDTPRSATRHDPHG